MCPRRCEPGERCAVQGADAVRTIAWCLVRFRPGARLALPWDVRSDCRNPSQRPVRGGAVPVNLSRNGLDHSTADGEAFKLQDEVRPRSVHEGGPRRLEPQASQAIREASFALNRGGADLGRIALVHRNSRQRSAHTMETAGGGVYDSARSADGRRDERSAGFDEISFSEGMRAGVDVVDARAWPRPE